MSQWMGQQPVSEIRTRGTMRHTMSEVPKRSGMSGSGLGRLAGASIPLLFLAGIPASAAAQAVLLGRTVSDSSRDPIGSVEVVVEKLKLKTESGTDGTFTLPNLDWGVHTAVIRKIGYRPVKLQLMVASDDTVRLDVRLRTSAVE